MNELLTTYKTLSNTQVIVLGAMVCSLVFLVASGKVEITDTYDAKKDIHKISIKSVSNE